MTMQQYTDAGTGLRIRVHSGPGSHAYLLIHGMGGGLSNWKPLETAVVGRAPTVAVELPWHGQSRPHKPCLTAQDVVTLVSEAALSAWPGPFVAVGHSLGGFLSMGIAARHPERIAHVALVSGHLFSLSDLIAGRVRRGDDPALQFALWRALFVTSTPLPAPLLRAFDKHQLIRALLLPPFFNPALLRERTDVGDSLADHTGRGTRQIYRLSRTVNLAEMAKTCVAPVTLVEGGRDPLLRPQDAELAHRLLRIRRYHLLPDCAHWVIVESPSDLVSILLEID